MISALNRTVHRNDPLRIVAGCISLAGITYPQWGPKIKGTWEALGSRRKPRHILTELELELLQFIALTVIERPVTTSAIIAHKEFIDTSPYLLEQSLINLRNLG